MEGGRHTAGLQGVHNTLHVGQHHSLVTLHNDWSECYWPEIIQYSGRWLGSSSERGAMVVVLKQEGMVLWLRERLKVEVRTSASISHML